MELTFSILSFVVIVLYVVVDKYFIPHVKSDTITSVEETISAVEGIAQKFDIVIKMAQQFVVLAKTEMKDATGEEKREWVITKLKEFCDTLDIVLNDDQLRAINEGAYKAMVKS